MPFPLLSSPGALPSALLTLGPLPCLQAGGPHCLQAMQLLLAHGAQLNGQDQDGRTALHQAIRYNRLAEAKWLVSIHVLLTFITDRHQNSVLA